MIELIPIGEIDKTIPETLKVPLHDIFTQTVQTDVAIPLPRLARHRKRILVTQLLSHLRSPQPGDRTLGIVDIDIFAPAFNFLFGEADITKKKAVISLMRLRPEFYGLPPDEELFRRRVLTEAVHELGHTYSLGHCPDAKCVMHFSSTLEDTDHKGWNFCPRCREKLIKL